MKKCLEHLQSWYGCYCILLLVMVIIILLGMTQNNGRYQIAGNSDISCWIIDTKTSQLWVRFPEGGWELGTNSLPVNYLMPEAK